MRDVLAKSHRRASLPRHQEGRRTLPWLGALGRPSPALPQALRALEPEPRTPLGMAPPPYAPRAVHTYIVGITGKGKSTLMAHRAARDGSRAFIVTPRLRRQSTSTECP